MLGDQKNSNVLLPGVVLPFGLASRLFLKALLQNDNCSCVTKRFTVINRPPERVGHFCPKDKSVERISFLSFLGNPNHLQSVSIAVA